MNKEAENPEIALNFEEIHKNAVCLKSSPFYFVLSFPGFGSFNFSKFLNFCCF